MLVKTNPGEKCPREDNPRTYITDDPKGTEVVDSAYYRRLVADGSLLIVTAAAKTKTGGDQ
jgi:hypothetical protein